MIIEGLIDSVFDHFSEYGILRCAQNDKVCG